MADLFNIDGLPYSQEAEQAVLGCVLKNADCFLDVSDKVRPDEFYIELNKSIFAEMVSLDAMGKKIDPVVINERLKADGVWGDSDGKKYLLELAQSVPSTANVVQYAGIVREKYYLRQVIEASQKTIEEAGSVGDDAGIIIEAAEKRIFDIRSGRSIDSKPELVENILIGEVMPRLGRLADGDENEKGIDTGYELLDKTLAGFNKGNLIIVGARPAMGKTGIALNFAKNATMKFHRTAVFFSLEMSKEEIAERLLSNDSGVGSMQLKSGEMSAAEWKELGKSVGRFKGVNLYIDDKSSMTVSEIKSRVRRIPGVGIVFIDYLGLIQPSGKKENRVQEVSAITRELKIMAKELQIPVVACAQLNRGSAEGRARKPVLTDLRESGSIEQDADVVLFLHRDIYYSKEQGEDTPPEEDVDPTQADLIVAKNRHGGLNEIKLHFDAEHSKFTVLQFVKETDLE